MGASPAVKMKAGTSGKEKPMLSVERGHGHREVDVESDIGQEDGLSIPDGSDLTLEGREALVLKYRMKARKLARSILRKWHARLDLQEVDSLVDLSLCEAVKRYNPRKGASFMTFMFFHLRGNLIRAVAGAVNANAVPGVEEDHPQGQNAGTEPEGEGSGHRSAFRVATASEVAEALCSHDGKLPDELLFRKELVAISTEACARLDPLEREVINRIYLQEQQLLDIADTLGYSRCHISRVKKRALEALYEDLSNSIPFETMGKRPSFEDDEESGKRRNPAAARPAERRTIRRRRPRSGKAAGPGAIASA